MSEIFTGRSGITYYTDDRVKTRRGGEGTVYVATNGRVIKIYHDSVLNTRSYELRDKIEYMCRHPPSDRVIRYLAWPVDVIYVGGIFKGFVMESLDGYEEIGKLYSYVVKSPKPQDLELLLAYNLCILTKEIHSKGYIIGDFNPSNIGFRPLGDIRRGEVCLYDNDSFQFTDNSGRVFRCNVQCEEYVAPEIMEETEQTRRQFVMNNRNPNTVTMADLKRGWTEDTDNFALAVHIFKLMFNGYNPYDSKPIGSGNGTSSFSGQTTRSSSTVAPSLNQCTLNHWYMFNDGREPFPLHVPNPNYFPPYIMDLFRKAFASPLNGSHRPTPEMWIAALDRYSNEIVRCGKHYEHVCWNGSKICPYCEAMHGPQVTATVSFDTDRGTHVASMYAEPGKQITLPDGNDTHYSRHSLLRWEDSAGNGYSPGSVFTVQSNCVLHAVWIYALAIDYRKLILITLGIYVMVYLVLMFVILDTGRIYFELCVVPFLLFSFFIYHYICVVDDISRTFPTDIDCFRN